MDDMFAAGHNRPPAVDPEQIDAARQKVDAFNEAAKVWLNLGAIQSTEQSEKLTDFISGARKLFKEIDGIRADQKKPHDDAAKAVQTAFKPLLDTIDRIAEKVKPLQGAWLTKLAAEEEARKRKAAAEAEALRKAAEEAQKAAAAENDVSAQVEAERLAEQAEQAAAAAARTENARSGSASGAGRTMALRTLREVTITNPMQAFMRYRDNPGVLEALRVAASVEVRAAGYDGKPIPGVEVTERKVAA